MGSSTLGDILRGTLDGTPESAGGFAAEAPPAAAPGSDISHLDHKYWKCVDTSNKDCSTQTKISSLGGHSPFAIYGHHDCVYSKELKCVNDLILKRLFCEKGLEQIFIFSLFFTCRRIFSLMILLFMFLYICKHRFSPEWGRKGAYVTRQTR